jgi:hypothetical protein
MAEDHVESVKDKQKVKDQLGDRAENQLTVSKWRTEQLNVYNVRVQISKIPIGTAFIIGHSINGKIGTQTPQNVIGEGTLGEWEVISETAGPEKITDAGIQAIVNWLNADTVAAFNYVAYGSGTTDFAVTQTALTTETDRVVASNGGPKL